MGENPTLIVEPEVPVTEPGKKRKIPFDIRCSIVRYYDSLPNDGSKGSYLRRNGLFKSSVNQWRADLRAEVPAPKQHGRKPLDSTQRELRRLQAENAKLKTELERANTIIDVQKKVSQLLELHMDPKVFVS